MVTYTSGNKEPRATSGAWELMGESSSQHLQWYNQTDDDFNLAGLLIPLEMNFPFLGNTYNQVTYVPDEGLFGFGDKYKISPSEEGNLVHPAIQLDELGTISPELYVEYGSGWVRFVGTILYWDDADKTVINDSRYAKELVLFDDGDIEIRKGYDNDTADGTVGDSSGTTNIPIDNNIWSAVLTDDGSPYTVHDQTHTTEGPSPLPIGEVKNEIGSTSSQPANWDKIEHCYVYSDSEAQDRGKNRSIRTSVDGSNYAVIPHQSVGSDRGNKVVINNTSENKELREYLDYSNESHYRPTHWRTPGRGSAGLANNQGTWEWSSNVSGVEDKHRFDVDNGAYWEVEYPVFTDGDDNVISLDGMDHIRVGTAFAEVTSQDRDWYFHVRDDSGNWNEQILQQTWPANKDFIIWETNIPTTNITGFAWCMIDYYDESYSTYFDYSENEEGKAFGAYGSETYSVGY